MRGGGEFWGRSPTGRMPRTVQGVPFLIAEAVKERGSLLYLSTATGTMTEELPHTVPHGGSPLALVLANAGLVQGDGADGDGMVLLVRHDGHDLHVLEACDGLPIDVCHQLVVAQTSLPCRAFLVHSLHGEEGRGGEGRRGEYEHRNNNTSTCMYVCNCI